MDSVRLESYSKALGEEFAEDYDTLYVLDRLVKNGRGEFEAKIPDMGVLLDLVRERKAERLKAIRERKMREEHAAYLKDMKENPDNYVSMAQIFAEYEERKKARGAA